MLIKEKLVQKTETISSKIKHSAEGKFTEGIEKTRKDMYHPIPNTVRNLWNAWNIRAFILLSLFLQTVLVLLAPLRRATLNRSVIFFLWSAYLMADWSAGVAVGLIGQSLGDNTTSDAEIQHLAFWASFLLVHFGGPDTITAFNLEDNELWIRNLFVLVVQVIAVLYIYIQSFPYNKFSIPTLLLLIVGIIKYTERIRALHLANKDSFRESLLKKPAGPDTAVILEEIKRNYHGDEKDRVQKAIDYSARNRHKKSSTSETTLEEILADSLDVVRIARKYFATFKGLIVDLVFSLRSRKECRRFFQKLGAEDALDIIAVELNLFYDALFTKAAVVHNRTGYFLRCVSFNFVLISLALFCFIREKNGLDKYDIGITYTLLLGAISLEFVAVLMLVFSDWAASITKSNYTFIEQFPLLEEIQMGASSTALFQL